MACSLDFSLGAHSDFSHNWMIAGAIALVAFTLATFISFRPIRNAAFEFFLISHIVLIAYVWGFHAVDAVSHMCTEFS